MDVRLRIAHHGVNFGDLEALAAELDEKQEGSYSTNFAQFLSDEKSKLRSQFVDPSHPNAEAYAEVFDTSSDMIESTLEQVWCTNFDLDVVQKRLDQLEHDVYKVESACEDFQHEWAGLSLWKRILQWNLDAKISRKLLSRKKSVDAIVLEYEGIAKEELRGTISCSIMFKLNENRRMIKREEQSQWGIGEDRLSHLRVLLLRRQRSSLSQMHRECFFASITVQDRLLGIGERIVRKREWAMEQETECHKYTDCHWLCLIILNFIIKIIVTFEI